MQRQVTRRSGRPWRSSGRCDRRPRTVRGRRPSCSGTGRRRRPGWPLGGHAGPRVEGHPRSGALAGSAATCRWLTGVLDAQLHVLVRRRQRAARGLELGDADDRGRAVTARPPAVVAIVQARRRRSPPAMSTAASTMAPTASPTRRGSVEAGCVRAVSPCQGRSGRASDAPMPRGRLRPRRHPARLRVRAQPSDGRGA